MTSSALPPDPTGPAEATAPAASVSGNPRTHAVEIRYCTGCRWMLRAAWLAQELLVTFETDLERIALVPGSGGVFDVLLDGEIVWSRAAEKRHADLPELKQRIRDRIAPGRSLGHSDGRGAEGR